MTAAALARSQAEMWAQRVTEAEAALCHTTEPRALRAAIAAHQQHEADWQANRRTDAYVKLESQAQRQSAQQETVARRAAEQRATERLRVMQESARVLLEAQARSEAEQLAAKRWVTAVARQEAVQRQVAKQNAVAVAAGLRAAGAAARRAAHKQAEAARIDYRETLHNGAWRGWGGLSQQDRAERVAAPDWFTDIDDTDGWTKHVVAAHFALIPPSLMNLR